MQFTVETVLIAHLLEFFLKNARTIGPGKIL